MKKLFLFLTAVFCLAMSAYAQRTVTGTVVDAETDEPLVAATVLPIGGGTGTITDIDGNFSLNLPGSVKEIKFSYVGYATQTVAVSDKMNIALVPDNKLETVVVTGYGSGKKLGSVVGAVSVVGEEQFQNVPTATFVDALQGQVSGLSIYSASGDPSSIDNDIRLRGVNSITAGNTPLFILDGAPVSQNVFTTLNPSDIESVTVLKDAASVAIYGSRAANGVIVITSKKGKFGEKAKVSLRASYGWSQIASDNVDMMSAKQYVEYRDKIGQPVSAEARQAAFDYGINTDWMDEVFDSHAPTYSLEGVVQGGSETMSYYLSLNHYDAEGIMPQSAMRRESLRLNLSARVAPWLRIGFQSNFGYTKYETNNESNSAYGNSTPSIYNPMMFARFAMPYDSPYYYTIGDDGRPVFGDRAEYLHFTDALTPQAVAKNRSVWSNRVTANMTLSEMITPINGLVIRAQQNVDAYDSRIDNKVYPTENFTTPMGDYYNWDGDNTGFAQQAFTRYYAFTYTNTAEYSFSVNDVHNITALVGQESIVAKSNAFGASASGYTDPRLMLLGTTGTSASYSNLSESVAQQTFNSFFFNASYDFDNKYFVEGTFRRDGSSKFAPGHRWSSFWSVGGKWNMKAESFLQPVTWLDDLQFHISYGTTGNSSIDNYMYFGTVEPTGGSYMGGAGLVIGNPANSDLTWETVKSFDVGFNFGFLNIFSGEIDFYHKKTCDMLMTIPWSYTTGYSAGFGNIGSMKNVGVDINLQADIIKTRDWYWALRANFNYNNNEITELFNGQDTFTVPNTGIQYAVGHSAGEHYTVLWAGVDPRDGQTMWYDKDGNLTKTYNEERDAVLTGKSAFAPYSGGFGTDLRWKNLSLRVDFAWAAKKYLINNDRAYIENNTNATQFNQMTSMMDVWTTPGQVTDIPKVGVPFQFDSHVIEDASFCRLKNLTFQYALPRNVLNKMRLENLSFHFTGRNLLTFTGFSGVDPEPESNLVRFYYPNTRQYEFGFDVTF